MSWNGSNNTVGRSGSDRRDQRINKSNNPAIRHGLLAGLIIVSLGGAAVWWFGGRGVSSAMSTPKGEKHSGGTISEVKPSVPTKKAENTEPPKPIDKSKLSKAWQKYYDGRDTNKWMVVYNPITKQEFISRIVVCGSNDQKPALYKNNSLNLLDAIAFEPITSIMPNVEIDERFMQNFQNAMLEKIEISKDDSEDVIERKQNMIDLLTELKQRIKDGEDIQDVIRESLKDRNRVANLRIEMEREQVRMEEAGSSPDEIEEFVKLCNGKLKEKGASPIHSDREVAEMIEESDREAEEKKLEESKQKGN